MEQKKNEEEPTKEPRRKQSWISTALVRTKKTLSHHDLDAEEKGERSKISVGAFLWNQVLREFEIPQKKEYLNGELREIGVETNVFKYFKKWKGKKWIGPPRYLHPWHQLFAFIGSFCGIGLLAILQQYVFRQYQYTLLIGSFGASSVLLYTTPDSPLAQPRNVILSHPIAALIGVSLRLIFGGIPECYWLMCALAVSLSIVATNLTNTTHPPAGATALTCVIGSRDLIMMDFLLIPFVTLGATLLLIVALVVNNINSAMRYPQFWW